MVLAGPWFSGKTRHSHCRNGSPILPGSTGPLKPSGHCADLFTNRASPMAEPSGSGPGFNSRWVHEFACGVAESVVLQMKFVLRYYKSQRATIKGIYAY